MGINSKKKATNYDNDDNINDKKLAKLQTCSNSMLFKIKNSLASSTRKGT